MATKLKDIKYDIAYFDLIKDWIPGRKDWDHITGTEAVNRLLNMGCLAVHALFEHAAANAKGTRVVSEDTHDLDDGSDCKLASPRVHSNGKAYAANVSNIHGKTGDLIVLSYEPMTRRGYLFRIPRSAYGHIAKGSNIDILFHRDGTPKWDTKWWRYCINCIAR